MSENGLIMQYFEWELPNDGQLWNKIKADAPHLKQIGVTSVWLPPAYKAISQDDVGYAIYDLYDLGEFDQKGTVRTKYGTKEEYIAAIDALHEHGIGAYADVVLNHKAGADETERFMAYEVNPENRQEKLSEPYEIEAWTKFTFPGRKGKHSDFQWNWTHFTGTDFNVEDEKKAIYMIKGVNKGWSDDETVDNEFGNFDYLMFADIDYENPEVVEEIKRWANWYVDEAKLDGFRLDAVKHINYHFIKELVTDIREKGRPEFFAVGEYWRHDYDSLQQYLEATDYTFDLFDVSLHYHFHEASVAGSDYDLRKICEDTLIAKIPTHAVTFVDNHDSQPGQSLESYVERWFKPLAYSFILLRLEGFPCLFYGDYYGISGENPIEGMASRLDKILYLRANHAYGDQHDYFDDPNCIGWTRMGNEEHPYGLAVIMSNGDDNKKKMYVGEQYAGETFADYSGNREEKIVIDEEGCGEFLVKGGTVSVWVKDGVTPEEAFHPLEEA
ncbi:alpha-amylase [Jeotgalibaca caeni]|uniref:alpha-amylase n=1 Tax=Jeotgalibaca caeni TaxID=3028623 RepID=UPI00237E1648|nr:alpha-amylase [Jeotgalibaca caeni]MDE1548588.1 alpha-amylase [Jeotgalibaca caeni]